uniref:CSON009010 protein n=1 Tax=Culicoides sonorensis TaxID=179676 RepID=A0A336LE54_CULSO
MLQYEVSLVAYFLLITFCFVNSTPTSGNGTVTKVYEKCQGPGDPGLCKNFLYKWRYESSTNACNTFVWGGCGGNSMNRFDSELECLQACQVAEQPAEPESSLTSSTTAASISSTTEIPRITETPPLVVATASTKIKDGTTPVPFEQRGSELTFEETGTEKTFMFAQNNTFIQMDGELIQTFQLRLCREISFQFRTKLPHGLLVYHNVKNPAGINLDPYALYVIVEKGQLKVVHVFGKHSTSVTVGEGLNRDEWHSVMVRIDVHGARLIARVDSNQEEVYLKGLNHDTNYGVSINLPSVVLVGGLSSEEKLHGVKYIIESFVGCIRNVVLSSGKAASDLLPITPLIATKHENVKEGCINKCHTRENLCFYGSRCINHYYELSCDCFGTLYEGEQCDIYTATTLTLRGSSYVSYRIYDWKDRVHSPMTRISMIFKTRYDDSALFYASGEHVKHQYVAASIKNHSVYIEMDFGHGQMSATLGTAVTSHYWYNLTIFHNRKTVKIVLDNEVKTLEIPGGIKNLLFDPEIYFGGGPDLHKKKGLASHNNFAGSLKYVFYNDFSVLYELKKGNPKAHYIGVLEAEFYEADVEVIPITYPFATSHIWWPITDPNELNIKFDFRSSRTTAVLAYSDVTTPDGQGFWEVRLASSKLTFDLCPDINSNITISTPIKIDSASGWHAIEVGYKNNEITFTVDYRHKITQMYGLTFNIGDKVIIGSSLKAATSGLVGCMRDLEINGVAIEPRYVVKTERVVGEVALDNCKFVDPCKRPNTCEHGGKCFVKDDRITCDCKGTGYIGKNCHFTKFRKTCEELALLGYTKPDVYLIDIDGNGIFPPAHVKCDFQSLDDATKTIVEHNLPSQTDVRNVNYDDFSFHIKYREFSAEMLQELISHSLYCTQYIKYDCYKAPLELHSATWFESSAKNSTVDHLGHVKRGACPCSVNKTCEEPLQSCNCDHVENKWFSDEGRYEDPASLGIMNMYFLQQKDLTEESQGRITLGPLECVETNTQKYVVTFTTSQSYIEVPGWRKGDIAFSFRTTGEKAILLFQPPIRPNYPSFMVALTGDYQLTFNFTLSTGTTRELVINSNRKLNAGEWHKIWIDYNEYHVRFMINTDYQMVDLLPEEEFGPFEGSMFIGGSTSELLKKSAVKQGLIGCFRGLVVNGEILDIYSYMSVHLSEIIKDCKPSCVPSPCKNGAQCKELWSTFQCVCSNPWAHLGQFCETNINEKALTFIYSESYLKRNYFGDETQAERDILRNIMKENILINLRTYDKHSLVLYANDHLNNFVHIFVTDSNKVVFLYNHGNEIVNLTLAYNALNSGKSIQLALIRTEESTTLHVNEANITVDKGYSLLTEYSNKPWINPEMEVLSPHRPPAPPTDYFQINVGGYDPVNLLRANTEMPALEGFVGCIRGLKIGEYLVDLPEMAEHNLAANTTGVLKNCQMKCDSEPCKNGGICTENFAKQESTCNCEHTSFLGEFCSEEKGADFSGESALHRKFVLEGRLDEIKLQLSFSSGDLRRASRVMLLIQTVNDRSYYLMVAITADGHLQFEEDREGTAYGAKLERNFLNSARHSIYYKRYMEDAVLMIDRENIPLVPITVQALTQMTEVGMNSVQLGGINTTDPRFAVYKSYSGCLSNVFIQVNNYTMKPLEEYMLFTKAIEAEYITVFNSQGVRSAQCNAHFEEITQVISEPSLNSTGTAKTWVEDAPKRVPYTFTYPQRGEKEEKTQVVFTVLTAMFIIIIVCCLIEVYRTDRAHKKRIERETDEDIIWSREQATKMHESPGLGVKVFKPDEINGIRRKSSEKNLVGILKNGTYGSKPVIATENEKPKQEEKPPKDESIPEPHNPVYRESQLIDHEPQWESLIAEDQETEADKLLSDKSSTTDDDNNNNNNNNNPDDEAIENTRSVRIKQYHIDTYTSANKKHPDTSLHEATTSASSYSEHEAPQSGDEPLLVSRPSFRSRNRPVISWGPPPVAAYNMTQLPFKIDETPSSKGGGATPKTSESEESNEQKDINNGEDEGLVMKLNGDDESDDDDDEESSESDASECDEIQLNPDDVPDSISRIAGPTPLSSSNNNNDTYHIGNVPLRRFQQVKSVMQPVFIDHENRQFLNPISYIGGPRLDSNGRQQIDRTNRNSIDSITSILSID